MCSMGTNYSTSVLFTDTCMASDMISKIHFSFRIPRHNLLCFVTMLNVASERNIPDIIRHSRMVMFNIIIPWRIRFHISRSPIHLPSVDLFIWSCGWKRYVLYSSSQKGGHTFHDALLVFTVYCRVAVVFWSLWYWLWLFFCFTASTAHSDV